VLGGLLSPLWWATLYGRARVVNVHQDGMTDTVDGKVAALVSAAQSGNRDTKLPCTFAQRQHVRVKVGHRGVFSRDSSETVERFTSRLQHTI
jgi:hypothetical protein